MESLELIDKFCSSPLVIFLNMAYTFLQVKRNGGTMKIYFIEYTFVSIEYKYILIS